MSEPSGLTRLTVLPAPMGGVEAARRIRDLERRVAALEAAWRDFKINKPQPKVEAPAVAPSRRGLGDVPW